MKNSIAGGWRHEKSAPGTAAEPSDAAGLRPAPDDGSEDPIICHWELGPEELPEFHRIVRTHERTSPTALAPPVGASPVVKARTSTLAPLAVITRRGASAEGGGWPQLRRRHWQRPAYAVLLSTLVTGAIVTLNVDHPTAESTRPTSALLTTRALGALDSRAAALDRSEGKEDPALVGQDVEESTPMPSSRTNPLGHPDRPSLPIGPVREGPTDETTDSTATGATAPGQVKVPVGESALPPGRAKRKPRITGQPLDDDYPPDETQVTWRHEPRTQAPSTEAQTRTTRLRPNRRSGARHLEAVPRQR